MTSAEPAATEAAGRPPAPYLAGLDGLRGAACLAVIVAHCWGHFAPDATPPGAAQLLSVGLVIFFAMSGLLIYLPFVRDIVAGERRLDVASYTRRRLARVFPAYLVIFLVCDLALAAVYVENAVDVQTTNSDVGTGRITDPLTFVANLTLTQTFLPETIQTGINPSWSLTTELTFYALLPLLALPLVRFARDERRGLLLALVPAAVLVVAGLAGRLWAEWWFDRRPGLEPFSAEFGANGIAVLSRSLLGLADNFGYGMVVAVALVGMERGRLPWLTRGRIVGLGVPVVLACGALGAVLHDPHPWFTGSAMAIASAVVLLVLVEPTARRTPSAIVRVAANRPLEHVGRVSLSVYLWHYPMVVLASRYDLVGGDTILTMLWAPVLVSSASLLLGSLTYAYVERPAMEAAKRRPGRG